MLPSFIPLEWLAMCLFNFNGIIFTGSIQTIHLTPYQGGRGVSLQSVNPYKQKKAWQCNSTVELGVLALGRRQVF